VTARRRKALALIGGASLLLLAPTAYAEHLLEYRPAVKADARGSPCLGGEPGKQLEAPLQAGARLPVQVAWGDVTRFRVTRSTRLRVRDVTAASDTGRPSFEVWVVPEADSTEPVRTAIRAHPGCHWWVTLDGRVVQLELPGERSDGALAGGWFASLDEALRAYGRSRKQVALEVVPQALEGRELVHWTWQHQLDRWRLACEFNMRSSFRRSHPEEFAALAPIFRDFDCSHPPQRPGDDLAGGHSETPEPGALGGAKR
jgi:hypothetical protein